MEVLPINQESIQGFTKFHLLKACHNYPSCSLHILQNLGKPYGHISFFSLTFSYSEAMSINIPWLSLCIANIKNSTIFQKSLLVSLSSFSIRISPRPLVVLRPFLQRKLRDFSSVLLSAHRDLLLEAVLSASCPNQTLFSAFLGLLCWWGSPKASIMVRWLDLFSW